MRIFSDVLFRMRALFRRREIEADLDDELRSHLQHETDKRVKAGARRDEAVREARMAFGAVDKYKEEARESRGVHFIENLIYDVRFAIRTLRKNPGFTAIAVLTLALGIGANTAIFSVTESVLLRPLPFQHADRLFLLWAKLPAQPSVKIGASGPDFQDYKEQSRSIEYVTEFYPRFRYSWTGYGDPKTVICTGVTEDFFPMLGMKPLLGRVYTPQEYHHDGVEVVLSERFWREQLGADPGVIGRVLTLSTAPMTVVGVMPSVPDFFPDTEIWAKIVPEFDWMRSRSNKLLSVLVRLKQNVTPTQAEQELTAILRRAPGEAPDVNVTLVPLKEELVGKVKTQVEIVMASAGLVLLITCVNAAYLFLARATRRRPEIAVRISLGASRGRILRQFLTENLLLALLGGGIGIWLAVNLVQALKQMYLITLPRGEAINVDGYALIFGILITLLMTLILAWWASRAFSGIDLISTLRTARANTGNSPRHRFTALLVSEVSLAVVLLVSAGLLVRSFWLIQRTDPGFHPDHVLTAFFRTNYFTQEGGKFYNKVLDGISSVPGVEAAAVATACMPGSAAPVATLTFDDRPNDPRNLPTAEDCWISPDFFRAIGTSLLSGRTFSLRDDALAPPVVIVNRAFARHFWPNQNPIGKRVAPDLIGPGHHVAGALRFREVVGVVADIKQNGLDVPAQPALYSAFLQDETNHDFSGTNLFVRSRLDPRSLPDGIRAAVHTVEPDQPLDLIQTMDDVLLRTLAPRRFSLILVASFAFLALVLSAIGIYGMVSYSVSARTAEFGLRLALGAQCADVLRMVLREVMGMAIAGVAIGVVAALVFMQFIRGLLFGVNASDPLTFVAVALLLAATALLAGYVPARRATRVDPMTALRNE